MLLASGDYVHVYVEKGPPLPPGDNVFVFDGRRWVPVDVVYVPEAVSTYVVAAGKWADVPHYKLDRHLLVVPREALGRKTRLPATPSGL